MSERKNLPIEAIEWFSERLDQIIEETVERVALFFNATDDIENGDEETQALADIIIEMHQKQLESLDFQIIKWLTLKPNKEQLKVLSHCQEQMLDLYRLQDLFVQGAPGKSGHGLQ